MVARQLGEVFSRTNLPNDQLGLFSRTDDDLRGSDFLGLMELPGVLFLVVADFLFRRPEA